MTRNDHETPLSAEAVENQVRQVVADGQNIASEVERISRQALDTGNLEIQRMQSVVASIGRGAREGANEQPEHARQAIGEAFNGMQNALLHSFETAKLATEEQAKRMEAVYENDVKTRLSEFWQMEGAMLDSLAQSARAGTDAGATAINEVVQHAQRSGTQFGEEVQRSISTMAQTLPAALRETALAGLGAARETTARTGEAASGILQGVANTLSQKDSATQQAPSSRTDSPDDQSQT